MRRSSILVALGLAFGLVAPLACFPGYEVAPNGAGGGANADDGGAGAHDATVHGDGASSSGDDGSGNNNPPGGDDSGNGNPGDDSGNSSGGDGGSNPFDSSTQALVPKGSFTLSSPQGQAQTTASFTHDVLFDRLEVTTAQFDAWINAGKPLPADGQSLDPGGPYDGQMWWKAEWNNTANTQGYNDTANCTNAQALESTEFDIMTPTYAMYLASPSTAAKYPVNCVNWYQAVAYCWWSGNKRLATEAEFQYEITGLTRSYTYPWGNAPPPTDCTRAIWRGTDGGSLNKWNGCQFPKAVGSAPTGGSFDGVLDMQGSVEEWIWNRPNNEYPPSWPADYAGPPNDSGPDPTRSARGGSWFTGASSGEMDGRLYDSLGPTSVYTDLGIRCVKSRL
jgi:formylglycine-generating enzyme required for sulfatase activity